MSEPLEKTVDDVLDETESGELQVEVVDDVSEKPRKPVGEGPDLPEDDDGELAGYSAKVKKRISKLTFEAREQRRQAEAIGRERDAAVEFANRALSETRILKKALNNGREIIAGEMKGRVSNAMEIAKASLRSAKEMGDIDKEIEASQEIARLTVEQDKVTSFKPVPLDEGDDRAYAPPRAKPAPDEKAKDWHSRNQWFGRDETKTAFSRHIHEKLVVFENVDPRSDNYWKLMDTEMRKKFPDLAPVDEDDDEVEEIEVVTQKKRPSVVVAPVNRNTKPPRKVTLTASEVAISKRLGLTLEQYAESKIKGAF